MRVLHVFLLLALIGSIVGRTMLSPNSDESLSESSSGESSSEESLSGKLSSEESSSEKSKVETGGGLMLGVDWVMNFFYFSIFYLLFNQITDHGRCGSNPGVSNWSIRSIIWHIVYRMIRNWMLPY